MSYEQKAPSPGSSSLQGAGDEEKKVVGGYDVGVYGAGNNAHPDDVVYDPSQESRLTRLGLNFESFKRAPGTTRGLVAHGDVPPEYLQHDNPLLQQKMKPRHLQMIAVGEQHQSSTNNTHADVRWIYRYWFVRRIW